MKSKIPHQQGTASRSPRPKIKIFFLQRKTYDYRQFFALSHCNCSPTWPFFIFGIHIPVADLSVFWSAVSWRTRALLPHRNSQYCESNIHSKSVFQQRYKLMRANGFPYFKSRQQFKHLQRSNLKFEQSWLEWSLFKGWFKREIETAALSGYWIQWDIRLSA